MSNINLSGFNCVIGMTDNFIPAPLGKSISSLTNSPYFFSLNDELAYHRAYKECPPLKSIVSKRARAFNNGILELVKTTSSGNYAKDEWSVKLLDKLDSPNPMQSGKQFRAQQNIYIDIYGYCPVFITRPVGLVDEITNIWNIPPWLFDLEYTNKWLQQNTVEGIINKFKVRFGGQDIELDKDNLFFIFDDGIGTDEDSNLLIPDSRLMGQEYPICNIIGAYKSRNTLIVKRGAIGILSNEGADAVGTIPLPEGEKRNLQSEFSRYGLVGQEWQVIITEANLKWQQMALPTKDLMLFEEIIDSTNQLLDAYSYPPELFATVSKNVTFENKKYAKKDLYSNVIIPEGDSRIEQLGRGLIPKDKKVKLKYDFSGVDVLQEEEKTKAEVRQAINVAARTEYEAGLITKNDWRIRLGEDTLTDPEFNTYKAHEQTTSEN